MLIHSVTVSGSQLQSLRFSSVSKTHPFQVPTIAPYTLSSINEVDLFESLRSVLPHIQLLWELVLLGEPVVVMAPTPTVCASTVLALVSSISPLR